MQSAQLASELVVALDAMGGDHAPASVIGGAAIALAHDKRLRFLIYGDEVQIQRLLSEHPGLPRVSEIIHTPDAILPDEKPSVALRKGKNSSMQLAIRAVADQKAACVISAGNTGALMAMSKLAFRTLPGIQRPAIATLFPTRRGFSVLLDMGANVECAATHLFQFALMGDAFAKAVLEIERPSVGILNVGSEEVKGHEQVRGAAQMLREAPININFKGFVEGDDICAGTVDVVVTDGFTGNVAIKVAEGLARMLGHDMKKAFKGSLMAKIGYLLMAPAIRPLKQKLNPRHYNGAMFLGLNGIAVKSHGSADAESFANAIGVGADIARHKLNAKIVEELSLSGSVSQDVEDTMVKEGM